MSTTSTFVLIAAYASVAAELIFLHVPSVVSTVRLLSPHHSDAKRSPRNRVFLMLIPLPFIYATFALPWLFLWMGYNPLDDYVFEPNALAQSCGIVVIVCGRAITLLASLTIRRNNRQEKQSFFLHTRGPYSWSRNPGLVGMYTFVLGIWLIFPSLLMFTGIVIYIVHMHVKVRMEEAFLSGKFGPDYEKYKLATRRYF